MPLLMCSAQSDVHCSQGLAGCLLSPAWLFGKSQKQCWGHVEC